MQDKRPLTDRAWQDGVKHKLIQYLSEHAYSHTISPQLLNVPPVREFVNMVIFLLKGAFGPTFEIAGKFEEELPRIFKEMGYPFTLPKASLKNAISPHDWPKLLGSLAWMVDNLNYFEARSSDEERDAGGGFNTGFEADEDAAHKMYLDYLARGYKLYMAGHDDTSALDEEMQLTFDSVSMRRGAPP